MLEIRVDGRLEHRGQLGVQAVLDHGAQLVGADNHEVLEWLALMGAEQSVGNAARVSRDLLLDAALEAGLRPAALGMPAVKLIVDQRELAQPARAAAKQPRGPAAEDRDAPVGGQRYLSGPHLEGAGDAA